MEYEGEFSIELLRKACKRLDDQEVPFPRYLATREGVFGPFEDKEDGRRPSRYPPKG